MNSITRYASLSQFYLEFLSLTCFLILARETPTPVIKWDIKQTILNHKIKTLFLLYYILYFLVKVSMTQYMLNILIFTIMIQNEFAGKHCSYFSTLQNKHTLENRNGRNICFNRVANKPVLYITCIALSEKTSLNFCLRTYSTPINNPAHTKQKNLQSICKYAI